MNFRDILSQWESLGQLSRDIDVNYELVKKWNQRGAIPSCYWLAVANAAHRRGYLVSVNDMAAIQQKKAA
jgi:hypothetical protein